MPAQPDPTRTGITIRFDRENLETMRRVAEARGASLQTIIEPLVEKELLGTGTQGQMELNVDRNVGLLIEKIEGEIIPKLRNIKKGKGINKTKKKAARRK